MKPFEQLSERGQAQRLQPMALEALKNYDLDVADVRLITNEYNGIFRLETTGGERWILRVCRPGERTPDEILSEMEWLAALRRDTDMIVPKPLETREGKLTCRVAVPGVPETRTCVVFSWLDGRGVSDRPPQATARRMGAAMADLHAHAAAFRPSNADALGKLDTVWPFGKPEIIYSDEPDDVFTPERRELIRGIAERVQNEIDQLHAAANGARFIHCDLHQWNVKTHQGSIRLLDFDDCTFGSPLQDIAISNYYLQGYRDTDALREQFRLGYEERRSWPEQWLGQIDLLMVGRRLDLLNWIINRGGAIWANKLPDQMARIEERLREYVELAEMRRGAN